MQAKLSDSIIMGLCARKTKPQRPLYCVGIAKCHDSIVGNRIIGSTINCAAVIFNIFKRCESLYLVSQRDMSQHKENKKRAASPYRCTCGLERNVWLRHTGAFAHTLSHHFLHLRTFSALPSSLVVFLFAGLLFLVFSLSSSSSVCRVSPPPPKIQSDLRHGCCRIAFFLVAAPQFVLRLTACGRPVGLPTALTQ